MKEYKIAVIVGYHSFEFQPFQEMFESFPGMHCYIQHLEQFTSSSEQVRKSYDAVVFYTMRHQTPVNDGPWYEGHVLDALSQLGDTNQGIVILHHTLLAFENWPVWKEITGLNPDGYQDYKLDVPMQFFPVPTNHPITEGIREFGMTDEAYQWKRGSLENNSTVLLTTDASENMKEVAWIRTYRKAKVFCYQSGHAQQAYQNPNFRKILYQGIHWTIAGTAKN